MGMPIACSNAGPMPEVLRDAGELFDPQDPVSIADAIEILITDSVRRHAHQIKLHEIAPSLTWARCAETTFGYLCKTLDHSN